MQKQENTEIKVPQNVRFTYLWDMDNPRRVLSIARTFDKNSREVRFAYSICSPKDMHRKKTAHKICLERLETEPYIHTIGDDDSVLESIFNRLSVEAKEVLAKKIVLDEMNLYYDSDDSEYVYSE